MDFLNENSRLFINSPWSIGSLKLRHRLIQGPLAGYSCAPFRLLFNYFTAPAYCVSEMCSATDLMNKQDPNSRYLYRAPEEQLLAYQISGHDIGIMAKAAAYLQSLGADLIDINCGCPKSKIRKKGAGSALLEQPQHLLKLIQAVKDSISIPLTIKIRIQGNEEDFILAKKMEEAGIDAVIVHGRRWVDGYEVGCDFEQIAKIKQVLSIPVIANGDLRDFLSLEQAIERTGCDGFMISRAGTGKPWLYQELLGGKFIEVYMQEKISLFMQHLLELAKLESERKAVLQSKSLVKYYFSKEMVALSNFYGLDSLDSIHRQLITTRGLPPLPLS